MASVSPKHRRRSIRLRGCDYASAGAYFVTICIQHRVCLFGKVTDGELQLNKAGQIVKQWWKQLPKNFPTVEMDTSVVTPNHFHGIILFVGAATRGRPYIGKHHGLV